MLCHQLSCPIGGLLLSVLVLKDANPNHYPVPGVECVVSHESRQFTDDGHKVLLGHLGHPLRVGNTLVSAHCNVHSFSPPPKLDFSHLGAPQSASANGSINALRLSSGQCAHTDPQKVPEAFEERTRLFLLAQRGGGAQACPKGTPRKVELEASQSGPFRSTASLVLPREEQ